jgi:DNA-binding response OmpR family regulator
MDQQAQRLTILMIEIEQPEGLTARKLVAETMKHNVLTAYTGEEGLDLFYRNSADVVLVHRRLPGIAAEEVVRCIRAERPEVPLLVVRATDDETDEFALPVDAYIRPHHIEDLVDFLHRISEQKLKRQPAEHPRTDLVPRTET